MRLHLRVCVILVPTLLIAGCIGTSDDSGLFEEDPLPTPTVSHMVFEGRIICGLGAEQGTTNPCLLVGDSKNLFNFQVAEGTETLLVGLTWTPTTALGEELQVLVESKGFTVFGSTGYRYGVASGQPDLVLRIDDDDIGEFDWSWGNITGHSALQARVFPARTDPPTITIDQPFELHVAAHLHASAPPEASPFAPGHVDHDV